MTCKDCYHYDACKFYNKNLPEEYNPIEWQCDNFTCQDCGEFHALINNFNMPVPIDDGQLEVHHILPVSKGGGDEQQNLITLCKKCHKKRHKDMKEKEQNK